MRVIPNHHSGRIRRALCCVAIFGGLIIPASLGISVATQAPPVPAWTANQHRCVPFWAIQREGCSVLLLDSALYGILGRLDKPMLGIIESVFPVSSLGNQERHWLSGVDPSVR